MADSRRAQILYHLLSDMKDKLSSDVVDDDDYYYYHYYHYPTTTIPAHSDAYV